MSGPLLAPVDEHGNCRCHDCIVAGVERPSVTISGRELHGVSLRDYWRAREQLRHTLDVVKDLGPLPKRRRPWERGL